MNFYYQASVDGGETPGTPAVLNDASLASEPTSFSGQDTIRPFVSMSTSSSWLTVPGLIAPRVTEVVINYLGGWSEDSEPTPAAWTEDA